MTHVARLQCLLVLKGPNRGSYGWFGFFARAKSPRAPFATVLGPPCSQIRMERWSGPVLCEAPSCKHPYISHSYLRTPWVTPWVTPWSPWCWGCPQSLALLCLLPRRQLHRLHRPHRARAPVARLRAEPMETVEDETSDTSPVEPTWLDKMRRACGLRRFDVVARIALSLKDTETAMELVQALAFECLKHQAFFLKALLREFRLRNVAPELAVELFWKTELWFRAQGPKIYEWNEVVYAFVLANHYEGAWDLVTSMEDADPRMPVSWMNLRVSCNPNPPGVKLLNLSRTAGRGTSLVFLYVFVACHIMPYHSILVLMNSEFIQQGISPNSVATLGFLMVWVKACCSFEVASYVCSIVDDHFTAKTIFHPKLDETSSPLQLQIRAISILFPPISTVCPVYVLDFRHPLQPPTASFCFPWPPSRGPVWQTRS